MYKGNLNREEANERRSKPSIFRKDRGFQKQGLARATCCVSWGIVSNLWQCCCSKRRKVLFVLVLLFMPQANQSLPLQQLQQAGVSGISRNNNKAVS